MSWRETTIDRAADWMRFAGRAAMIINWVMLAVASVFVSFWLLFRLVQWLFVNVFRNPW